MKKISVLAIVLIIFNFICISFFAENVYAETEASESSNGTMTIDEYKAMADSGKVTIGSEQGNVERDISLGDSDVGSFASGMASFLSTISAICAQLMSNITKDGGFYYTESDYGASNTGLFTINSLVFGEYLMFNAKAYETSTDLNSEAPQSAVTATLDFMKERGAAIGHLVVRVGLFLALPMVILSIIRTVSAQKADDLAAWKKILTRWVLCVFLMFFFEYILAAIDTVCDILVQALWKIRLGLEESGYQPFEVTVETSLMKTLQNTGGVTSLAYAVEFVAIIVLQVLFLLKYVIRTFGIIALFIIAPIVILIHSFNLMRGKQSDTLGEFFKTYIVLTFMQPLHAFFYLIFFFSVSEIVINVPILGIILIYALYRAGNIAKAMFGWDMGSSILSLKK